MCISHNRGVGWGWGTSSYTQNPPLLKVRKLTLIHCYHLNLKRHPSFANYPHNVIFVAKGSSSRSQVASVVMTLWAPSSWSSSPFFPWFLCPDTCRMPLNFVFIWFRQESCIFVRNTVKVTLGSSHCSSLCGAQFVCPSSGDTHLGPSGRVAFARFPIHSDQWFRFLSQIFCGNN